MPSPVMSQGTPGNVINGVSVAASKTISAFLDLSAVFEGQVTCETTVGTTAPTAGTVFSAFKVYGNSTPITISTFTSSTSITVSSATGIHLGQKIGLQQAGGSKLGEVVTVSGISGNVLTISPAINTYSINDNVYLINQTATATVQPASASGTWVASTDYSMPMVLGTGQWVVSANNTDATNAVTVSASVDKITSYA